MPNQEEKILKLNSLSDLIDVAVHGLRPMYDPEKKRFCYRMRLENDRFIREGDSYRYTLITLLGLSKLHLFCNRDPFGVNDLVSAQIENSKYIEYVGDAGLLIWLTSLTLQDRIAEVIHRIEPVSLLNRFRDGRTSKTTELSWLLTGLSYAKIEARVPMAIVDQLALETYDKIKRNYGGKGIFRHEGTRTLTGKIRGHIGTFADQVYPIYALSVYSRVYGDEEASNMAKACADAICCNQGDMGQWWWYYNADTGTVAGYHPVYSVHQDGMGPMALYAVQDVTRIYYTKSIMKGLDWLYGENELQRSMVSKRHNLIMRCVWAGMSKRNEDLLRAILHFNPILRNRGLNVLRECRPYHLGWLLYALSSKAKL